MSAETIASALGKTSRKSGGGFMACCPAHDDSTASLSIDDGETGKPLVRCFAGCSQEAVVSELKNLGLWPEPEKVPDTPPVKRRVVARFNYNDEYGKIIYWKERIEPGRDGRKKEFRFRHIDPFTGKDAFGHGKHNPHVLYNLPKVLKSKSVIVVEGERLADILAEWNLVATTLDAGSASRLVPEQIVQLSDKRIAILRDNDEPGIVYSTNFASDLHGKCESLKVILLPDLAVKEDFKEWQVKPGNDKAALLAIIKESPEWEPSAKSDIDNSGLFISAHQLLSTTITIHYLIDKVIEVDTTGQIFGPSGGGKTFVALCMALAIATGRDWNGCKVKQGIVLYLAGEGRNGLVRRLKAWHMHNEGADLSLLQLSRWTISLDGEGAGRVITDGLALSARLGVPVALIVVDTLARHLPGDENNTKDMSAFIAAIDTVRAAFEGSTGLIIHHTGNDEDKMNRSRGSSALKAAMDFEIQCHRGLLKFTKMKDAEQPEPIPFKLIPVEIGRSEDGETITSCIVEYGERSERNKLTDFTPYESMAINALLNVSAEENRLINDRYAGNTGEWRKEYYAMRKAEDADVKQGTLKKGFQNAAKGLSDKQVLLQLGNDSILIREDHQQRINILIPAQDMKRETGNEREVDGIIPEEGKRETGTPVYTGVPASPLIVPGDSQAPETASDVPDFDF